MLDSIRRPRVRHVAPWLLLLALVGCTDDDPTMLMSTLPSDQVSANATRPATASAAEPAAEPAASVAAPVPASSLPAASLPASVATVDDVNAAWIEANYVKTEQLVPMRDGVQLHTAVYTPRDVIGGPYPILMIRTPYSSRPYGSDAYPRRLGPAPEFAIDGYIFVSQDVRGCYLSEGEFVNMTPHVADKQTATDVDESTDTFDTIDWLLANVPGHNGRVGMYGTSYPGFYAAAGAIDAHPALIASSPQAPIADWWYDDFKHNGAFFMPHAFNFLSVFGQPRPEPTTGRNQRQFEFGTPDGYEWYLNVAGTTRALQDVFLQGISEFWTGMVENPDRNEFWTSRDILPHLRNMAPNILVVGGWFDAEDLYGPLNIYGTIERENPSVNNRIIMGPWVHGGWHRTPGNRLGDVTYGEPNRDFFVNEIERPWFAHHLKDGPSPNLPEAMVFETGVNQWRRFDAWPPSTMQPTAIHARDGGRLAWDAPTADESPSTGFVSDPAKPVPFTQDISIRMTREYMVEDQRFASRRPDVLTFRSEPLAEPMTLAGPIIAELVVSTDQADADWVVKLIDEQPGDAEDWPDMRAGARRGGFMQMVRSEIIRGRYREDPARPAPFESDVPTPVRLPLQDVLHTFPAGHRIVIQIQSTWFPLVDRNPQSWVDNIFLAEEDAYVAAVHRVFHGPGEVTRFLLPVLPAGD